MSDLSPLHKIRSKLYSAGFKSISLQSPDLRSSALIVDGARVSVKIVNPSGADGKWRVSLHRRGVLDESGVDAYIIVLQGVPGNATMPIYIVLSAPQDKSGFAFTFSSLTRRYSAHIEDWPTLKGIAQRVKKSAKAA